VSVARFIADQRTNYRVPHTLTCLMLGVSLAWFYKWLDRPPTPRQRQRPFRVGQQPTGLLGDGVGQVSEAPRAYLGAEKILGMGP
jgi:hypothetical protein